jgi:Domain of unknown function (DUF6916)
MVVSRRGFMKQGSLLVLAAGTSAVGAKSVLGSDSIAGNLVPQEGPPTTKAAASTFEYTKATFEPYVDTVFRIYADSTTAVKTTLVSVTDIGPVPDKKIPDRECFVIKFKGARPLAQDRYKLEHEKLGKFELLLVPAGRNRKGFYYQAVINRLNG